MRFTESKRQKLYEAHAQKWFAEKGYFLPLTAQERDEILRTEDHFPRTWNGTDKLLRQLLKKNQHDPKGSAELRKDYANGIMALADDGYDTGDLALTAHRNALENYEKWAKDERTTLELVRTICLSFNLLTYGADRGSARSAFQAFRFIATYMWKRKFDYRKKALIAHSQTTGPLNNLDKSLRVTSQRRGKHFLFQAAFLGSPKACEMIGDYYNGSSTVIEKAVKKPLIALHFYTHAIELTERGYPTKKLEDKMIGILESGEIAPHTKGYKEAVRVLEKQGREYTPKLQSAPT